MLIETKKLTKKYENAKNMIAVDQAEICVDHGETVGLFGESGSGKSTLGLMLAGLERPTSGEIFFEEKTLTMPYRGMVRRKIQILFQHPEISFNPALILLKSMIEPYKIYHLPYSYDGMLEYLAQYGLHEEHLLRTPSQLSGGELQRAALARVLLLEPEFLILDEPTSMLDMVSQAQMIRLLEQLQTETGVAYLFISHDRELCRKFCSRIHQLEQGRFTQTWTRADGNGLQK